MRYYLAIDIGASSGRHIVGWREKATQVYMLTAHLPRINTIRNQELKELAEAFGVKYRKDFLE